MATRATRSGKDLRACAGLLTSALLLSSGPVAWGGGEATNGAPTAGSKVKTPIASSPATAPKALSGKATPADAAQSQRRAVRGVPVEEGVESPELNELRRFEEQAFPRSGVSPASSADSDAVLEVPPSLPGRWDGTGDGPEALRAPETTLGSPRPVPAPDSEWLRSLQLPELPVRWDPQVLRYLDYFKNDPRGHAVMANWIRHAGRFRSMFEAALTREGLPKDLIYVAMVESGFETGARSPVGAGGVWQFMPGAARAYGLEVGYWVDARRDPERSVEAAARYLKDLYVRFGSWHLVFAAYNAGYGAVLKSITRYNTNDYWELCHHEAGLPWESSLYVPKILAAAIVGHNLQAFGLGDVVPDPPFACDRVEVPPGTALATVARATSARPEVIAALNPQIVRERIPPDRGKYEVRVPPGTAPLFAEAFERTRVQSDRFDTVTLRFGETLDDVAKTRHVPARELRRLNGVKDTTELRAGVTIIVPQRPTKVASGGAVGTKTAGATAGATAAAIAPPPLATGADRIGAALGVADGEDAAAGAAGDDDEILVAVPDRAFNYEGRERVFYRTRDGDTLDEIAEAVGVRPDDLVDWNNLDASAKLHPRMVLQIFVRKDFDPTQIVLLDAARVRVVTLGSQEFLDLDAARRGKKRLVIEARPGETLARIGRRYGLTVGDLARINRFSYNTELQPGQKVVVYSPVGATPRELAQGLAPEPRRDRGVAALIHGAGGGKTARKESGKAAIKDRADKADKADKADRSPGSVAVHGALRSPAKANEHAGGTVVGAKGASGRAVAANLASDHAKDHDEDRGGSKGSAGKGQAARAIAKKK